MDTLGDEHTQPRRAQFFAAAAIGPLAGGIARQRPVGRQFDHVAAFRPSLLAADTCSHMGLSWTISDRYFCVAVRPCVCTFHLKLVRMKRSAGSARCEGIAR